MRNHWLLDPAITFLNHGSFGATPRQVLAAQTRMQERLEAEPVRFFLREYGELLDLARRAVAAFVGAKPENLAFVTNATGAVNSVLRSLPLAAGDELLITNHAYGACRSILDWAAERAGARVVVAKIPFPIETPEQATQALLAALTPRTRLALLDHITSPTGLVLPLAEMVRELAERGVDSLVDGAHGPGMLNLDLEALGAAYYTGNLHKWVCAPKGAAFLHVREDRQEGLHPAQISHGIQTGWPGKSQFLAEFDWPGTQDFSAWLVMPEVLDVVAALDPAGWPGVRRRNRRLALEARDRLCETLAIPAPAPDEMIGSLVALPLPAGGPGAPPSPLYADPLGDWLLDEHRIEVPIVPWPAFPARLLRVSCHVYNEVEEYSRLGRVLAAKLRR